MSRIWFHIARAEFLALTARFRPKRKKTALVLLIFGTIWALLIAPSIVSLVFNVWLDSVASAILMALFPGLMRSLILFLWMILFFGPIAAALQEIKIGQWEIMLSNNVRTRDIMIGSFIARLPITGLMVLFIAPVLLSPFVIVYNVSLVGQVLMYLVILFIALSTTWFANLVGTALQAKLGESPRGKDLARAFSAIVGLSMMILIVSIELAAAPLASVMEGESLALLPFTWGADMITWTAVLFNGVGLTESEIAIFRSILGFGPAFNLALLTAFFVGTVGLALVTADRLFKIDSGARTEVIVRTGKENLFLRGVRRLSPKSFGVLVVTSLKDFGRKAQNVSNLGFGMLMALIIPTMMNVRIGPTEPVRAFFYYAITSTLILGFIGSMSFGGVAFLESKNHLWILKSAPYGVTKYVQARVVQSLVLAIPIAAVYTAIGSVIMAFGFIECVGLLAISTLAMTGSIMIGTGVTANNPNYEDTQSQAFKDNVGMTMMTTLPSTLGSIIILGILTGFENLGFLAFGPGVVLVIVGSVMVIVGTRRLARPD